MKKSQNFWDADKAVIRGKYITLNAHIKKNRKVYMLKSQKNSITLNQYKQKERNNTNYKSIKLRTINITESLKSQKRILWKANKIEKLQQE